MSMPTFWDLLQRVKDETGTSEAWVLKQADLNHGTFSAWRKRGIPVLPPRRNLLLMAHAMRVDYEHLIDVILHDTGYLPGSVALKDEASSRRWGNRGNPASLDERTRRELEEYRREQERQAVERQKEPGPAAPKESAQDRGTAG